VTVVARAWQAAFLARHAATTDRDFLLVATPGAGKTMAACLAAHPTGCEQLFVVCPTTALRFQWLTRRTASVCTWTRAGATPAVLAGRRGRGRRHHQQVASAPDVFAYDLARPTFVVLDEIHHDGESATGGNALLAAFDDARRRLAMSGTPFRSDERDPVRHLPDEDRRCAPDFVCGYGEAVADAVCCPLAFGLLEATLHRRVDAQKTIAASPTSSTHRTTRACCAPRSIPRRRCCPGCCATPTRCWSRRAP